MLLRVAPAREGVGVRVEEMEEVGQRVGEGQGVALRHCVTDTLKVEVMVTVGVRVAGGVPVAVTLGLGERVRGAVMVLQAVREAEGQRETLGLREEVEAGE